MSDTSLQIILSSVFFHKCKFPSCSLVRIQHDIHSFTSTLINTSIMMQLFPVNYITFDLINFQSFIFFSPPSSPPQPIINLQSTLGRIVQKTYEG